MANTNCHEVEVITPSNDRANQCFSVDVNIIDQNSSQCFNVIVSKKFMKDCPFSESERDQAIVLSDLIEGCYVNIIDQNSNQLYKLTNNDTIYGRMIYDANRINPQYGEETECGQYASPTGGYFLDWIDCITGKVVGLSMGYWT